MLGKDIARAADRDHSARVSWVILDRCADAGDVDVNRAVEGLQLIIFRQLHKRLTRHHPPGTTGEGQQQLELMAGERTDFSVEPHFARTVIDVESAKAQHVRPGRAFGAPQDCLKSRRQLTRLKRLAEIIIGALCERAAK